MSADHALGTTAEWTARRLELWQQLGALFLREGFRNLTIGDLAARLSCSRRTLYSLAESRDELVRGVVEQLFEQRLRAAHDAAADAAPGADAVVAMLANGLLALDASALFVEELRSRPSTAAMFTGYRERERAALVEVLADAAAAGRLAVDDPELVADVLDGAVERLAWRRARGDGPAIETVIAELGTLVRGWLTAG